jgi:hypothetical protein
MILQIPGPNDCFLTGFCGAARDHVGPPPGLMFLALGLIGLGLAILVDERRRVRRERSGRPTGGRPPDER